MWRWLHEWGSPPIFFRRTRLWPRVFAVAAVISLVIGLYLSLIKSPPDYQMHDAVRIMYVHVPAAWLSLMFYMIMAAAALVGLIWRIKIAHALAAAAAPVGAIFTALALITGMIWGKPMWGAWWVWDARLTSELILLFLYLGVIALRSALPDLQRGDQAAGLLAVVGVVNIPIIHYSVVWWQTLHQPASIARFAAPSIDSTMLAALLVMMLAFKLIALGAWIRLGRSEILRRDARKQWVKDWVLSAQSGA